MQRIAAIFTVLVFSVLIGGLLSRGSAIPRSRLGDFEPTSAPSLPPLVDPTGAAGPASQARSDRLVLRLVDPAGNPVGAAALVVRSGASTLWAFSGEDGTATLEGLSAGKSRLAVLAFPHPGLEVDIEPGSALREIVLAPAPQTPARIPDIARSRFAGRLAWEDADSPLGYELMLLPVDPASTLGGALPRSVTCDAKGQFSLAGLAHGRYLLRVLPSWASGGSWPDLCAASARELNFERDTDDFVLELARGRIEGEVRDDLGRALEGALVLANEIGNESHAWPPSSTGPDGRFQFIDLPPGKYRVTCRAGEGGSSIEELAVEAGAATWAALPAFAARKRP